jgi:hypothetical protein
MDVKRIRTLLSLLIPSVALIAGMAHIARGAETPVTVRLDTEHPGANIPPAFSGLSFEVALVLPGPNGVHYFRRSNSSCPRRPLRL